MDYKDYEILKTVKSESGLSYPTYNKANAAFEEGILLGYKIGQKLLKKQQERIVIRIKGEIMSNENMGFEEWLEYLQITTDCPNKENKKMIINGIKTGAQLAWDYQQQK